MRTAEEAESAGSGADPDAEVYFICAQAKINSSVPTMELRKLIEDLIREGAEIEIDGKGIFQLDEQSNLIFQRQDRITVFLAYAQEDACVVKRLYRCLLREGFEPWMDKEELLPGQNWPRAIERAIDVSDFFVACLSAHSTNKRGHFQSELGYAMNVATRLPPDDAFFTPVRLDDCQIPRYIKDKIHWVDLFPDWNAGVTKLREAMTQLQKEKRNDSR